MRTIKIDEAAKNGKRKRIERDSEATRARMRKNGGEARKRRADDEKWKNVERAYINGRRNNPDKKDDEEIDECGTTAQQLTEAGRGYRGNNKERRPQASRTRRQKETPEGNARKKRGASKDGKTDKKWNRMKKEIMDKNNNKTMNEEIQVLRPDYATQLASQCNMQTRVFVQQLVKWLQGVFNNEKVKNMKPSDFIKQFRERTLKGIMARLNANSPKALQEDYDRYVRKNMRLFEAVDDNALDAMTETQHMIRDMLLAVRNFCVPSMSVKTLVELLGYWTPVGYGGVNEAFKANNRANKKESIQDTIDAGISDNFCEDKVLNVQFNRINQTILRTPARYGSSNINVEDNGNKINFSVDIACKFEFWFNVEISISDDGMYDVWGQFTVDGLETDCNFNSEYEGPYSEDDIHIVFDYIINAIKHPKEFEEYRY